MKLKKNNLVELAGSLEQNTFILKGTLIFPIKYLAKKLNVFLLFFKAYEKCYSIKN